MSSLKMLQKISFASFRIKSCNYTYFVKPMQSMHERKKGLVGSREK